MEKLDSARSLLKHTQPPGEITPAILSIVPGYTVFIAENCFELAGTPIVRIFRDEDLLTIYGYAVRCFDGDPIFDDFEGALMGINGGDEMKDVFVDIFYALAMFDEQGLCRIISFEEYRAKQKQTFTD